jgi:hypothetical protein
MQGTFKLDNPEEMQATMTVTMTVKEWTVIHDNLLKGPYHYVEATFRNLVRGLIDTARTMFIDDGSGEDD